MKRRAKKRFPAASSRQIMRAPGWFLMVALATLSLACPSSTHLSTGGDEYIIVPYIAYGGLWLDTREPVAETRLGRAESPEDFLDLVAELARDGYQLFDFEAFPDSKSSNYAGAWEASETFYPCHLGLDRTEFDSLASELRQEGNQLIDLELYSEGKNLQIAAIWRPEPQADPDRIMMDMDWNLLKTSQPDICPDEFFIENIEPYYENDQATFAAVCHRGDKEAWLQYGSDLDVFWREAKEVRPGSILVDFEAFLLEGDEVYIGIWTHGNGFSWRRVGVWSDVEAVHRILSSGGDPRDHEESEYIPLDRFSATGSIGVEKHRRLIDLELLGKRYRLQWRGGRYTHGTVHAEPVTVPSQ